VPAGFGQRSTVAHSIIRAVLVPRMLVREIASARIGGKLRDKARWPTRGSLIGKGMVWSPNHGDTAFTVPVFDEFMHRIMPGED